MLFEIALALIFAKGLNFLFERIRQPGVIGEIVAGIVLGPSILGSLSGSSVQLFGMDLILPQFNLNSPEFKEIAFIGVIFLLFIVGLETDIKGLKQTRRSGLLVGVFGVVIPFLFGCGFGLAFNMSLAQSMALGAIFLSTSITIAIRILNDADMLSTRVGLTLHTAVILNDILAIFIFSLIFGEGDLLNLSIRIAAFFIITIGVGLIIIKYIVHRISPKKMPLILMPVGLVICFLFATFAENIGIAAIIGAFIAGFIIRKVTQTYVIVEQIKTIGYLFFIPLFFVWIGVSFDISLFLQLNQFDFVFIFIILFVFFGLFGNFIGGFIGAKLSGMSKRESISIGIGMMPIMGVALIILSTEIDKGIFGSADSPLVQQIKLGTLLLIVTSSLITPPLLRRSMGSTLLKRIQKGKTRLAYSPPETNCLTCNSPLRLIFEENRWYCDTCKKYQEVTFPSKTSYQLPSIKTNKNLLLYFIGAFVIISWYIIQGLNITDIGQKIAAAIGITIGVILGFFTVKYLFIKD